MCWGDIILKIAICDKEEDCIEDIEKHLNQYFSQHNLYPELFKFSNSTDILSSSKSFDIAILGIEVDEINGIEIGKKLQKTKPDTALIYVTEYDHYLDDALDLGVIRFFTKPIERDRFFRGLDFAIEKIDNTEIKFYLYDEAKGLATVNCTDIIYIEICGRKTMVVTKKNKYTSKENIKFWHDKLNKSYFEFPHKSFIINTNYITYYDRGRIILDEKYDIPIAYSKRAEFKQKFFELLSNK